MIKAVLKIKILKIMLNKAIRVNKRLIKDREDLWNNLGLNKVYNTTDSYIYVNCGYQDCLDDLDYLDKMSLKELISYYNFLKKDES